MNANRPAFLDSLGLTSLRMITDGCRPDMHEPDEQGIKARVIGDHLDNAFGTKIGEQALERGYQEFVVCIERVDEGGVRYYARFNLASLIALARLAS